jgi:beta-phosphoglucomutase
VVENAPLGIEAARAAGMTCVAVRSTLGARWLAAADLVVPEIARVLDHPLLAPGALGPN